MSTEDQARAVDVEALLQEVREIPNIMHARLQMVDDREPEYVIGQSLRNRVEAALSRQSDRARVEELERELIDRTKDRDEQTDLAALHASEAERWKKRATTAEQQLAEMKSERDALADALTKCRNQFDFYAREHRSANKLVKAETNQQFVDLCDDALAAISGERG